MAQIGILVGVNTKQIKNSSKKSDIDFFEEMKELRALSEACEIEIVDEVNQNLEAINKHTYIGKGKLEEIKIAIANHDADVIIFNDELTPSQINTLQKELEILVYDRTYVILEIFKRRARTKEALLQVDIASLRYMLPRLTGLRQGLSRQRGAGGAAHGKGQGETQLELDRRNIEDRIALLKTELETATKQRANQRVHRKQQNMQVVSLVGYTNSGKSTILNALLSFSNGIKKEVFEKDMLFATLETTTRAIRLESKREFLLTDTVGFVNKLPHHLVDAFKSTLEEIKESHLILHIVDSSNSNYENQIQTTNNVLESLGVKDIPIIYVFNKTDKLDNYLYIPPQYPNAIRISAKTHENLDNLLSAIEKELYKNHKIITYSIPYQRGDLINLLNEQSEVLKIEYLDNTIITAKVSEITYGMLRKYMLDESSN